MIDDKSFVIFDKYLHCKLLGIWLRLFQNKWLFSTLLNDNSIIKVCLYSFHLCCFKEEKKKNKYVDHNQN